MKHLRSGLLAGLTSTAVLTGVLPDNAVASGSAVVGPAIMVATVPTAGVVAGITSVSRSATGTFVVGWAAGTSNNEVTHPGYLRSLSADGTPLSPVVTVGNAVYQLDLVTRLTPAGDIVSSWINMTGDSQASFDPGNLEVQRYDSAGNPQGRLMNVSATPQEIVVLGGQFPYYESMIQPGAPALAMDSSGNFAVDWSSITQAGPCSPGYGGCLSFDSGKAYAARFSASGVETHWKTKIDSTPAEVAGLRQPEPRLSETLLDDGTLQMVFVGYDAIGLFQPYIQKFGPALTKIGAAINLGPLPDVESEVPLSAVTDPAGDVAIEWQDSQYHNFYVSRYSATGASMGSPIQVTPACDVFGAVMAMAPGGNLLVISGTQIMLGPTTYSCTINGQYYGADGSPLGASFVIDDGTAQLNAGNVSVGIDANGNATVAWSALTLALPHQGEVLARQVTSP